MLGRRIRKFFSEWFRLLLVGDEWSDRLLRWFFFAVALGVGFGLNNPLQGSASAFGTTIKFNVPVGAAILAFVASVWIAFTAGLATRVVGQVTLPDPQFIDCETVDWVKTGPGPTKRSWCRIEVLNNGARSPLRVRLNAVRPALPLNGLGGALEPMSVSTNDGEVTINQSERQKFDLFMMAWPLIVIRQRQVYGRGTTSEYIRKGPRRLLSYLVLLAVNEYVQPNSTCYEFDVQAHAGSVTKQATFEVQLTQRGPRIRKVRG